MSPRCPIDGLGQLVLGHPTYRGEYVGDVPVSFLFTSTTTGREPGIGLLFTVLGLGTAALVLFGGDRRGLDLLRRGVGLAAGAALILFATSVASLPYGGTIWGELRSGFYVAALGAVLTAVTGRLLTRR